MSKRLILATNNAHKLTEFRRILQPLGFDVLGLQEVGVNSTPEEDGDTFAQNAAIKAVAVKQSVGDFYVLADDSGLCVDALGGAPGVHSARYSGEGATSQSNNAKLLQALQGETNRSAHFACALVLLCPNGTRQDFIGECHGEIATEQFGEGGFGYDPLFLYEGTSFAAMSDGEKDAVSHRGKAVDKLVVYLTSVT